MTSTPNIDIVIDCDDVELLLNFWAAALGYRKVGSRGQYGLLLARGSCLSAGSDAASA